MSIGHPQFHKLSPSHLPDMFTEAALVLAGREQATEAMQRGLMAKCDWDRPDDVLVYQRDNRRERREVLLDRFVPDRVCARCQEVKPNPRQWVVIWVVGKPTLRHSAGRSWDSATSGYFTAVCRSCWQRQTEIHPFDLEGKLFCPAEKMYPLDGRRLRQIRDGCKLSVREMARQLGWSAGHLSKMERKNSMMTVGKAKALIFRLRQIGIAVGDDVDDMGRN